MSLSFDNNDEDWKFIKNSLKQSIAMRFITESEKKRF
tara:strand:- start:76 stop:186 length:111 start_codon:yes stop_codon:yes gene_type:complete